MNMFPLPQKPKIIKKDENKALIEISGLYPGYGVTLGNSLRRTLLSSLEGAAITKFEIKGASHEFSTIPGVLEDVIMIILNLKKIRFKMHTGEPQKGILKVKGERKIKASDFKLPPQVEIINKDAHIATLTDKKATLEMEVQIEKGIGYEPVERRKREKVEIGAIQIDAIYTPVKRVAFQVENMMVGERTDFDRLMLDIETDNSILPEEALVKACQVLIKHFSLISEGLELKEPKKEAEKEVKKEKPAKDLKELKIEGLNLSTRTINILGENRIKTVASLVRKNEEDILVFKGMGEAGLKEIKKALKKLNLGLKE